MRVILVSSRFFDDEDDLLDRGNCDVKLARKIHTRTRQTIEESNSRCLSYAIFIFDLSM